jgi:DNA-directed RNA polymerase specialized sigma24 family protein
LPRVRWLEGDSPPVQDTSVEEVEAPKPPEPKAEPPYLHGPVTDRELEIYNLMDVKGLNHKQVCEVLNLKAGSVRSAIYRARYKIARDSKS